MPMLSTTVFFPFVSYVLLKTGQRQLVGFLKLADCGITFHDRRIASLSNIHLVCNNCEHWQRPRNNGLDDRISVPTTTAPAMYDTHSSRSRLEHTHISWGVSTTAVHTGHARAASERTQFSLRPLLLSCLFRRTHSQFLSVLRELSSLAIGGIWQYSLTTVASSADASFFASQFLIACVHVVCNHDRRYYSSRQERPQFRVSHATANDSLTTKPWGTYSQTGVLQARVCPATSSPCFFECRNRVESRPAVKPMLVVGIFDRQSQQKKQFQGVFTPRRRLLNTNPPRPP